MIDELDNVMEEVDELEEFDNLEILDDVEGDLGSVGNQEIEVDQPHVVIHSKELKKLLSVAKHVAVSGGRDEIAHSIHFEVKDKKLLCRVSDREFFLKYYIPVLNSDNILKDQFAVPLKILDQLVKACSSKTAFIKNDNGEYTLRLIGGDMVLNEYDIEKDRFDYSGEVNKEDIVLSSVNLKKVLSDCTSFVSSILSINDQLMISKKGDGVYIFHENMVVKSLFDFGDIHFSLKTMRVLSKLLEGTDEELEYYKAVDQIDRGVISGSYFEFVFPTNFSKVDPVSKEMLDQTDFNAGIYVDFQQLRKIVEVADNLPYALGKMKVNYDIKDALQLEIMTQHSSSNSVFSLDGSIEGDVRPLKNELVLQAGVFSLILKIFSSNSSVKISLGNSGVGLSSDEYKAVFYVEERAD